MKVRRHKIYHGNRKGKNQRGLQSPRKTLSVRGMYKIRISKTTALSSLCLTTVTEESLSLMGRYPILLYTNCLMGQNLALEDVNISFFHLATSLCFGVYLQANSYRIPTFCRQLENSSEKYFFLLSIQRHLIFLPISRSTKLFTFKKQEKNWLFFSINHAQVCQVQSSMKVTK